MNRRSFIHKSCAATVAAFSAKHLFSFEGFEAFSGVDEKDKVIRTLAESLLRQWFS